MDNQNNKKSFVLRLSPKLHKELARWADEEFRSLNGQIEYLLAESVRKRTKKELFEEDAKKEIPIEKDKNNIK